MNVVPYFGPLIVTAVLSAVGLLQFGNVGGAVLVAAWRSRSRRRGDGADAAPLSRAGSLNHVAIFMAIAFWSWAWGASGMLLGVPMLMAFKAVCDHVDGLKPSRICSGPAATRSSRGLTPSATPAPVP